MSKGTNRLIRLLDQAFPGSNPSLTTPKKSSIMLKLVILDGSAISRDLLNSVLTNGGHHVVGDSNTSPAALAKMIKLRPQIVCVDIGQADADGMAILDTIR